MTALAITITVLSYFMAVAHFVKDKHLKDKQ